MSQHTLSQQPAVLRLIRNVSYFQTLSAEIVANLAAIATPFRYPAGSVIFLEDEPVAGLFVVQEGIVKISRVSQEGREQILHLIYPGDTFNDVAALDGGPNPATANAQTDVLVWCIQRQDLQWLAERYPALAWALIESIAQRTRHLVDLVEDLAMRSVRGRLARLLLDQAESSANDTVPRLLTQEEMAAQLGTVREMVGRTLRGLAADGIIEFDRHRIVILDLERLAKETVI